MTDNIKPEHYRTGEEDHYESWSKTYPFNEYRAIMQAIAERYIRRNKVDRVEDLDKAIYTLERLRKKEAEHAKKNSNAPQEDFNDITKDLGGLKTKIAGEYLGSDYLNHEDLIRRLSYDGYHYLARDKDGILCAYDGPPLKEEGESYWDDYRNFNYEHIFNDNFPEVKWTDDEPTKISKLLATYENGGENGN